MPTKKFLELQEFSDLDLSNELKDTETQYRKLKFDHAVKGLENPVILREIRRDIARLKTEVNKRELSKLTPESAADRTRIQQRRRKK